MSDQYEADVFYDDDGQAWTLQEGVLVEHDPETGEPVGIYDPESGEPLSVEGDDGADDDGQLEAAAALEERLAELEALAAEPRPVEYVQVDNRPDIDDVTRDMVAQRQHLEAAIDRPLTLSEQRRLAAETLPEVEHGQRPDLFEAMARLHDRGEGIDDIDSGHRAADHEARTRLMSERLADRERLEAYEAGGDDLAQDVAPASQAYFDMDDRGQRTQYMLERMQGRDLDQGSTYSSSDITDYPEE